MPRSSCDFCCNPVELARSVESYRAAELGILCAVLDALSGGGGVESNVNIQQVGGVATAVNNGVVGNGTLRVTVASDSTGQIKLAAGTALAGKFGIDQTTPGTTNAVSISQINSAATLAGNGVTGTGSQRVTIASDNTAFSVNATLTSGALVLGKVGIDQTTPGTTNGVALEQIGTTAVATGNGVVGTGVQRVSIASDNTAFPVTTTITTSAATYGATITAGAAGGVPTTGVNVHTNSSSVRILSVFSTLDVPAQISSDGGTTYPYTVNASSGSLMVDFGANGRHTASSISAKAIGSNSSSGSIYVGVTI